MNANLRRLVLLLAVLVVPSSGNEPCPTVSSLLEDTNAYVCPPASSGRVMYDSHTGSYTKYPGAISYGVYDPRYFSAHGYVSFNLAEFPDSATVVSVRLWYYQYEHGTYGGVLPYTSVVLIPDVNAPAQQLFQDISNGTEVDPGCYTSDGWVVRSFNGAGLAAVDSCIRTNDAIDLGIKGGVCAYGAAYGGGRFHPLRAYLEVTYATSVNYTDIVAIGTKLESYPLAVGDSVVLRGRFTNSGSRSGYDFWVVSSMNGTPRDSELVYGLMPGETLTVRAAFSPVQHTGTIELQMCSKVASDWCTHNDTAITIGYVFPAGTRRAESFELETTPSFPPEDWLVCNGGSVESWHRAGPGDRYAHAGSYYATSTGDDDWLITYGLSPNSTTPDTVGIFVSRPGGGCNPQVWALGSQDPTDVIGLLLDSAIQTSGWHELHIGLDQLDGRNVYVGFRTCGAGQVCLDDIWFTSERVPAVEEPTSGHAPALRLSLGQNPVTGDRVVLRYQASSPGPLTIDVTDALGRVVTHQRLPAAPESGQLSLVSGGWPTGVYFVKMTVGAASASAKCVVHKRHS